MSIENKIAGEDIKASYFSSLWKLKKLGFALRDLSEAGIFRLKNFKESHNPFTL